MSCCHFLNLNLIIAQPSFWIKKWHMKNNTFLILLLALGILNCNSINFPDKKAAKEIKNNPSALDDYLKDIKLPPGFKIAIYAEGVTNACSMALSPDGTLFVGTRDNGSVYALR